MTEKIVVISVDYYIGLHTYLKNKLLVDVFLCNVGLEVLRFEEAQEELVDNL